MAPETITCDSLEDARELHEQVERFGRLHGLAQASVFQLAVAIEELAINAHTYGASSGDRAVTMRVTLWIEDSAMIARLEDDGDRFDLFTDAPAPQTVIERSEKNVTGWQVRKLGAGIPLVMQLMDRVEYCWHDKKNVVTLKKDIDRG